MINNCEERLKDIIEAERAKTALTKVRDDLQQESTLKRSSYDLSRFGFGNCTPQELDKFIADYNLKIKEYEEQIEELKKKYHDSGCGTL